MLRTLLFLPLFFVSCQNGTSSRKDNILSPTTYSHPKRSSLSCSYSLWDHVYNPDRLMVLDSCIEVTGIIVESNADDDGDQHMLLKIDDHNAKLLTTANYSNKGGKLVIEAICINSIHRNKVGHACDGYINNVDIPKINDHVKVTGPLVIDTHNGWSEIHPITRIDNLK